MAQIKVSSFVKQVPESVRTQLPESLRQFRVALMPWLSQVYYTDKLLHYELVKLPSRYSESRLELGMHFESRDRSLNSDLLTGFESYMVEIWDELGDNWHAEPWDRGWTKVYTTIDFQVMDEDLVESVAHTMASMVVKLDPLFHRILSSRLAGHHQHLAATPRNKRSA
jgi:cation transport regulator ChaB